MTQKVLKLKIQEKIERMDAIELNALYAWIKSLEDSELSKEQWAMLKERKRKFLAGEAQGQTLVEAIDVVNKLRKK